MMCVIHGVCVCESEREMAKRDFDIVVSACVVSIQLI